MDNVYSDLFHNDSENLVGNIRMSHFFFVVVGNFLSRPVVSYLNGIKSENNSFLQQTLFFLDGNSEDCCCCIGTPSKMLDI